MANRSDAAAGVMRAFLFGLLASISIGGNVSAQTYDELAMKMGASYGAVRALDNVLNACTAVPNGDAVGRNGKKITWTGVGPIRRWRQTCQQVVDDTKAKIRQLHPTRLAELERDMDKLAPKMEAEARADVRKMMTTMQDERLGCYVLKEGYIEAVEKNCKP